MSFIHGLKTTVVEIHHGIHIFKMLNTDGRLQGHASLLSPQGNPNAGLS